MFISLLLPDSSCAGAKTYRMGLLFIHRKGNFGAIFLTEKTWTEQNCVWRHPLREGRPPCVAKSVSSLSSPRSICNHWPALFESVDQEPQNLPFGTLLGRSSQAPCAEVPYTEAGPMDEFGKRLRSFGNKALSNNNGDGNENVKKATGILSKTTTRVSYFFCTFLCRHCTTTTWKCLISRFVEGLHKGRRTFHRLSKLECSPQDINSREIRLHLTFSANCNYKPEFILKVTFSLPSPASMLLGSLSKGDRRAERKEYHFSIFFFPIAFDSKDVVCNLNSNGDTTIKRLNLDLTYKGVPCLGATNLSKFRMLYLNSYLRYWRSFLALKYPSITSSMLVKFKRNLLKR